MWRCRKIWDSPPRSIKNPGREPCKKLAFESRVSPHDLCCVADASSFATKMPLRHCPDPVCTRSHSCIHTHTVTCLPYAPNADFSRPSTKSTLMRGMLSLLTLLIWCLLLSGTCCTALKQMGRGNCGGPATFSMQHTGINGQMCETF
jgi:hypothetical protein